MTAHAWTPPGSDGPPSHPSSSPFSVLSGEPALSELDDFDDLGDLGGPASLDLGQGWTPPTPVDSKRTTETDDPRDPWAAADAPESPASPPRSAKTHGRVHSTASARSFTSLSAGTATLLVEGHPFLVDLVVFRHQSERFDKTVDERDGRAVALEGVSTSDFEVLHKALLLKEGNASASLTEADNLALLRVTDVWDFTRIRTAAIAQLDAIVAPAQRVALARVHRVPGWADEGVVALCVRPESVTDAEEAQLGKRDLRFLLDVRPFAVAGPEQTPVVSAQDDAQFHSLFPGVPPRERLLTYFGCAYAGRILFQGCLYVTKNHMCFHSPHFGPTLLTLPFADIGVLEKQWTAGLFANAIGVRMADGAYNKFCTLHTRNETLRLLQALHRFAQPEAM